jgi:hypothetical protein
MFANVGFDTACAFRRCCCGCAREERYGIVGFAVRMAWLVRRELVVLLARSRDERSMVVAERGGIGRCRD